MFCSRCFVISYVTFFLLSVCVCACLLKWQQNPAPHRQQRGQRVGGGKGKKGTRMGCKSASLNNKKIKNILLPVNPQEREKSAKKRSVQCEKNIHKKGRKKQRKKAESRAETTKAKKARQLLSIFVNLNQSWFCVFFVVSFFFQGFLPFFPFSPLFSEIYFTWHNLLKGVNGWEKRTCQLCHLKTHKLIAILKS